MFVDLRKYGKQVMIEATGAVIDMENAKDLKLKVAALQGRFEIKFLTLAQMDEFISQFTGSLGNVKADTEQK